MPLYAKNLFGALSTVAIFGPGLIGGSLALALRKCHPEAALRLWTRRSESLPSLREGLPGCHVSTDAAEVATGADLIVLCTPIGVMPGLAETIRPHVGESAIVTDAGSVKAPVVEKLGRILGDRFIGSHPMAGSEKSGFDAARADLFEKAVCIITPTAQSQPADVKTVQEFWQSLGCRILEMPPEEHDRAVGCVSHLPHAVAAALVNGVVLRSRSALAVAGSGYRDTTRIAAGPPGMWTEILLENKAGLLAGLNDFSTMLDEMKNLISSGDAAGLEGFLTRAQESRTLP